jgi:hypothetical protein
MKLRTLSIKENTQGCIHSKNEPHSIHLFLSKGQGLEIGN